MVNQDLLTRFFLPFDLNEGKVWLVIRSGHDCFPFFFD